MAHLTTEQTEAVHEAIAEQIARDSSYCLAAISEAVFLALSTL